MTNFTGQFSKATIERDKAMTQQEKIIKRLKRGWTSPLDALRDCGSMKLASRVSELRAAGIVVLDKWAADRAFKLYRLGK